MTSSLIDEPRAWLNKSDGQYLKVDFGENTDSSNNVITLVDTSSVDFIYIGSSLPSTTSNESKWRIQRVDLRLQEIKILFADSSSEFNKIWDDRSSYSYG